jgi:hemerythrin-like domain-containing protein
MRLPDKDRRTFLLVSAAACGGWALSGCAVAGAAKPPVSADDDKAKEVMASEDLMREHGVLRRALLVYRLSAISLRNNRRSIAPDALNRTALLFRRFGEDYHERRLEEEFIFPVVAARGGPAADLVRVLLAQHRRGREITDYIVSATRSGRIGRNAGALARAMDSMALMYEEHTAREDTVLFPAWKDALSGKQYDELSDRFEAIEHEMFGTDGFEDAVKQIAAIEETLGVADLAQFTAPRPPRG